MGKDIPLFDNMPGYLQENSNSFIQFCSKKKNSHDIMPVIQNICKSQQKYFRKRPTALNPLQSWMIIFEWFLLKEKLNNLNVWHLI